MAIRVLIASAVAAAAMFLWGFVFWGISGAAMALLSPLPEGARDDVIAVLRRDNLPAGMYVYPAPVDDMNDEEAMEENERLHEEGPRLRLAVKEGGPSMPPSCFVYGVLLNFAYALLGATMVAMGAGSLPSYGRRFQFLLVFSLAGAIWTNFGDVIWWFYPVSYGLGNLAYQFVAGVLMALIVAAIVRPKPAV